MDKTLQELGELLLKAVPTFIIILLLHFYLKRMFFKPLDKALEARNAAIEGARQQAEATQQRAERLVAEYEDSLRSARSEIYREQDEVRRKWRQEQAATVAEARHQAEGMVKDSRAQLAADVSAAKRTLAVESDRLADQIAASILRGGGH